MISLDKRTTKDLNLNKVEKIGDEKEVLIKKEVVGENQREELEIKDLKNENKNIEEKSDSEPKIENNKLKENKLDSSPSIEENKAGSFFSLPKLFSFFFSPSSNSKEEQTSNTTPLDREKLVFMVKENVKKGYTFFLF